MSKLVSRREPFSANWRRRIYGYDGAIIVAENARFAALQLLIDNRCAAILSNSLKVDFARFGDTKFFEQARRRFVDYTRHFFHSRKEANSPRSANCLRKLSTSASGKSLSSRCWAVNANGCSSGCRLRMDDSR